MSSEDRFQSANFNRPPRIQFPALPQEEIDIPAPPEQPDIPNQSWFVTIIPVMGIGVMAIFYIFRSGASDGSGLFFAIPLLLLGLFTIGGTIIAQRWRRKDYEQRRYENSINYIRMLEKKRARLQAAHDAQVAILATTFPRPHEYLNLALSRDQHLWERRPDDPDFVAVRIGVGLIPSNIAINAPDPDLDSEELDQALALADTYRYLRNAPAIISLLESWSVGISGRRNLVMEAVRSIVCELAITHAPQDLHIHLIAPQAHYENWRWLEWLPHTSQSHRGGAPDLLAFTTNHVRNLLGNLSQVIDERIERGDGAKAPHLLLLIDGPQLAESEPVYSTILREGSRVGASALCLVNSYENVPGDCVAVIDILDDGRFSYAHTGPETYETAGSAIDQLSAPDAEHIARALSAVIMHEVGGGGRIPRRVDFLDLYGVHRVEELRDAIAARWHRQISNGALPYPAPIGRESLTVTSELLLDEDHHGPHGVLAGTTGSGKSGLLQSLICALALEHDPRLVNFLLIDFKGGSTFNVFDELPHTVGAVTNLDVVRVERALEALKAETQTRQQFLKRMNVRDITQYHRYYSRTDAHIQDPAYQPLPHLFIIVDEFAQLAKEMPDFMRELVRTAQVGRSLGLHLILGTQSPMDVITDEMNANLQFRICLRVQNIEASRAMLRRPDAAYLPSGWPGRGYFQVGERGLFKQFQAAYVGGDYHLATEGEDETESGEEVVLELITDHGEVIDLLPEEERAASNGAEALAVGEEPYTTVRAITETVAQYARENGVRRMPPILLPPLEDQITLAAPFKKAVIGGWDGTRWAAPGRDHDGNLIRPGSAPVGLLDDIYNRTQNPLWIHLNTGDQERSSRKDGHVLVLGGPGTGKTTFLRTLALSLGLLHAPDRLHLYFLSFTGSGLNEVSRLPHAEQVVHGTESERVRRLFGRLIHMLDERQAGRVEGTPPTVVLFVDQYEQFRDSYYDYHMRDFERLIHEGRAVGIYLVITASSIAAVPDRVRSLVQQRIALQLASPSDYLLAVGQIGARAERTLPRGRAYIAGSPPLTCQISLPTSQSVAGGEDDVRDAMSALVEQMRAGYRALTEEPQAPALIRELPLRIPLETLPMPQDVDGAGIVTTLGRCDDDALSLFALDWIEDGPHFVVTGPPGSGKSNLLRAAVLSAARQYTPDELRFLLVDFTGRSLRPLEDLKHVIGRVTDVAELHMQLASLRVEMNAFHAHARDHEKHAGDAAPIPKTVLVIDDYDATSEMLGITSDTLRQLRDHARMHGDLGLHIWIAGYLERAVDPLVKHLLLKRSGFGLGIRESLHNLNVRTVDLPGEMMPEGRAFFSQHNSIRVVQTAWVENASLMVNRINTQTWAGYDRAQWANTMEGTAPDAGSHLAQESANTPEAGDEPSLDIDTDGLIQDLLGGSDDE